MTKKTQRTIIDFFSNHNMRVFLACLLITAVVWVLMSLSESKTLRYTHPLRFIGYDQNRYAIQSDTTITIEINGTGFELLKTVFWDTPPTITIDLKGRKPKQRKSIATADLTKDILTQLKLSDNQTIRFAEDSVVFYMHTRHSKKIKVDISNVACDFAPQYGIYDNPTVTPDSVTLYGDSASLASLQSIGTMPTKLHNIDADSTYTIDLKPVWKQFSDVYANTHSVKVHIPAERFAEATYTIPIKFMFRDSSVHAKVYPPTAVITCKVAMKDYKKITPDMFTANVFCENLHRQDTLPITVSQFPTNVRITNIKPEHVQYVVIK